MDRKFDSIIFDMDGTLWDAVDSYCEIWNATLTATGINRPPVVREDLIKLMGMTLDRIVSILVPEAVGNRAFLDALQNNECTMMPRLGGRLYPGVKDLMPILARHYKLYMVSNCFSDGLPTFLDYTGLKPYISDHLSFGNNGLDKAANIGIMVERHGLKAPMYVGDTEGDCISSHKAGVAFAWVSYGFGTVDNPDFILKNFDDLKTLLL